jgi:hypothetical protein
MSDHTDPGASLLKLLDDDTERYPYFLEQRFPHVLQRMVALWGKPQIAGYFDGLLAPPTGMGQGFPEQARREIEVVRAFHDRAELSKESQPIVNLPVRETLLSVLELHPEDYPASLENEHPQQLQKMLTLLGTPHLDNYLDTLLGAGEQARHEFSERALVEIMTIKALHRARHAALTTLPSQTPNPQSPRPVDDNGIDDEHVASLVFDRVQRW